MAPSSNMMHGLLEKSETELGQCALGQLLAFEPYFPHL